jgi:NAD-dependent deacetylase
MKPDMVIFGEKIDQEVWAKSMQYLKSCNVMIVVGTSGKVHPASELPKLAKDLGAYIIECNLSPTDYTGCISDIFIQGAASETLSLLVHLLCEKGTQASFLITPVTNVLI